LIKEIAVNSKIKPSLWFLVIFSCSVVACEPGIERDLQSLVNPAMELATLDSIRRQHDPDEVILAAISELSEINGICSDIGTKNRYWRVLAGQSPSAEFGDEEYVAYADELSTALLQGDYLTKIAVYRRVPQLRDGFRQQFYDQINDDIPVVDKPILLQVYLKTLIVEGALAGQSVFYVDQLIIDLGNANATLLQELNSDPSDQSDFMSIQSSLVRNAISARAMMQGNHGLADSLEYLIELNIDRSVVLDSMTTIGSQSVFSSSPIESQKEWLAQYIDWLLDVESSAHLNRLGVRYILNMYKYNPALEEDICSSLEVVENAYPNNQAIVSLAGSVRAALCD
jgi:hypothetical protein